MFTRVLIAPIYSRQPYVEGRFKNLTGLPEIFKDLCFFCCRLPNMCSSVKHYGAPRLHAELRSSRKPDHRYRGDDLRRQDQPHCCSSYQPDRDLQCHRSEYKFSSSRSLSMPLLIAFVEHSYYYFGDIADIIFTGV